MALKQLALIILFVSIFFTGAACDSDDDEIGRSMEPDDDSDDDADDNVYDDDTDSPDDDDAESYGFPDRIIEGPLNGVRYFSPDVYLTIDEDIVDLDAEFIIDDETTPVSRVRKLDLGDGFHKVDLYVDGELEDSSEFEIRSSDAERIVDENLDAFPATLQLPSANGSSTPVYIRLENTGGRTCSKINLRTSNQPDFRSVDSIRQWLDNETAGLSRRETALKLFEFVGRWLQFFAPPLDSGESFERNYMVPDIFQGWGYGQCGEHANVFLSLAQLIGWNVSETRENSLEGHVTAELMFDGQWHHIDVSSQSYYWDDDGRILSLEEVEGENASLIMNYADQLGFATGGGYLEVYVPVYESVSDNINYEKEAVFGDDRGFVLDAGDVLELYPFGFGLFLCDQCRWDPPLTSTGVLTRNLVNPLGLSTRIREPYPILGLILQFEAESPGDVSIRVRVVGKDADWADDVSVSFHPGEPIDLSGYLDYQQLGEINEVELEVLNSDAALDQLNIQVLYQYAPGLTPQITHDMRELIIDGDCGSVDLKLDVYDKVSAVSQADIGPWMGIVEDVKNDGRKLIALTIDVQDDEGRWASGHEVRVESDHPEWIEIFEATGRVDSLQFEPVRSDWLGPNRFFKDNLSEIVGIPIFTGQRTIWARSRGAFDEDLGLINFILLVDGEEKAQTQINFVAE